MEQNLTYDEPPFNFNIQNPYKWKIEKALNIEKEPNKLEMMWEHYAFLGQLNQSNGIDEEEYVTREAIISCSLGSRNIKLDTDEDHGVIAVNHKPLMTCEDCQANKNIFSFGTCEAMPAENNHCIPLLSKMWIQKKGNVYILNWKGEKFVEALLSSSYLTCLHGGLITVKGVPVKGDPNFNQNARIITFPDVVEGKLNGARKVLKPNDNWYSYQSKQDATVLFNGKSYYRIAVGPKVLDPQYPDDGKIHDDDFDNWGSIRIDVHLRLKGEYKGIKEINGEKLEPHKIIKCIVEDQKAHSYNIHPDTTEGRKHVLYEYNKNITASFDIENGLIQTGIAYPNSTNATNLKQGGPISVPNMEGSVIEFLSRNLDFTPGYYRLEMVVFLG